MRRPQSPTSDEVKTVQFSVPSVGRSVTPEEYMTRFHQLLEALDIPAERNGTRVMYGEMSEEEGGMVEPLMHLIDARFSHVRHDGEEPTS